MVLDKAKQRCVSFLHRFHRSTLLGKVNQLSENFGVKENITPLIARIPFRVILREYAEWISSSEKGMQSIEHFIVEKIKERTTRTLTTEQVQNIFKKNPCLLILDGVDEVTNVGLQDKLFENITDFLTRCESFLNCDIQVIATSRPTGYRHKLESLGFLRLFLSANE